MTGDGEDDLPLRGKLAADDDPPVARWRIAAFWIGLAVASFGGLLLLMAFVLETPFVATPKGIPADLASQPVAGWLQWSGFGLVVVGSALCWPGYQATFGSYRPPFRVREHGAWIGVAVAGYVLGASVLARRVARSAAPDSTKQHSADAVVVWVWVFVAVTSVVALVQRARSHRREERRIRDGGAMASGEADDLVG